MVRFLERENTKKRENSREKIRVLILEERERVDGCGIDGGGGRADEEGQGGGRLK